MLGFELRYNEEMNEVHIPVLLSDVIKYLRPSEGETYLDLTAGYGGHADKILEVTRNYNGAVLNDRDQNAIDFLKAKYNDVKPKLMHDDFYSTALRLVESEMRFDMILADFGVSSPQLDRGERGFSFAKEARLDMRMDESQELDAWTIVNKWSERKLADIFEQYAEERRGRAKLLAREICMKPEWRVGRVIARPYIGTNKDNFKRTPNRHDYALQPPVKTDMDALKDHGFIDMIVKRNKMRSTLSLLLHMHQEA